MFSRKIECSWDFQSNTLLKRSVISVLTSSFNLSPHSDIHNLNGKMESILRTIIALIIFVTHSYAQDCEDLMQPDQRSCTFKFLNSTLFEIKHLRRANEIVCEFEGDLSTLRYTCTPECSHC